MVLFTRNGTQYYGSRPPSRGPDAAPSRGMTPISVSESLDGASQTRPRANSEAPKRLSVFGSRSRSNTTTSPSPIYQSPASSMSSMDQSSRRSSQDGRSISSLGGERPESVAKSLISRGSRILRRQNSKFSIASSLTLDEEEEPEKEKYNFDVSELFQKGHKAHSRSNSITGVGLKKSISEPFNFHHVTHTNQRQLPALHRVTDNELVSEFSAIRASQAAKPELKGIRADDLHFKNFSSEDLSEQVSAESVEAKRSPSTTPPRSRASSRHLVTPPAIRNSRSIENFSRPALRSPISPTSPIAPPPRTSSRAACSPPGYESSTGTKDIIGTTPKVNIFDVSDPSAPENRSSLSLPTELLPEMEVGDGVPIAHAVTTADDTAKQLRPLAHAILPPELADVPEEDESNFWQGSPARSSRPSTGRSSLRHVQSFPSARVSIDRRPTSRQSSQTLSHSPLESPSVKSPRSLGAPFETELRPTSSSHRPSLAKRFSIGLKSIEGSWEDDIDYSYEHAAESNCDFDWDRRSFEEKEDGEVFYTPNELPVAPAPPSEPQSRFFPGAFRPPKLNTITSSLSVPDLEPTSAQSKSTTQEAITPLQAFGARGFAAGRSSRDSEYFKAKPALVISSTFEEAMTQEAMYEDLLSGSDQNDSRFPFYTHPDEQSTVSHPVSPRSSGSISKCNSQESILFSRAASVVRKHRSSNSVSSLPELVHSIHSSLNLSSMEPGIHMPADDVIKLPDVARSPANQYSSDTTQDAFQKRHSSSNAENPDVTPRLLRERSRTVSEVSTKEAPEFAVPVLPGRNTATPKARPVIGRRTSSRANYSLFPTPGPRSPGKEVVASS